MPKPGFLDLVNADSKPRERHQFQGEATPTGVTSEFVGDSAVKTTRELGITRYPLHDHNNVSRPGAQPCENQHLANSGIAMDVLKDSS